jgi:serine/threonine protein kinase
LREILALKGGRPNALFHSEQKHCYLVLEYASGGELFKVLKKSPHGRLDQATVASIVRQTANALQYLQACRVIHRDIKVTSKQQTPEGVMKACGFVSTFPLTT